MTRAVTLAEFADQNVFTADGSTNRVGIGTTLPTAKLEVDGTVDATSFTGSGSGLTGIVTTITQGSNISIDNSSGNVTITGLANTTNISADSIKVTGVSTIPTISGVTTFQEDVTFNKSISIGGTITYEDVTSVDSIGIITARSGINISAGGANIAGVITAANGIRIGAGQSIGSDGSSAIFYGDGSNLTGVISGVELLGDGTSVGTSITAINFSGATLSAASSGISTVTIAASGISTSASISSGITTYLDLNNAQSHKLTVSGVTTISCYGGEEGESHILRIINSGITTVGFSTYFLFPSGATPSLPEADGSISLLSFTVNRVGAAGTQLLTGASLNYS